MQRYGKLGEKPKHFCFFLSTAIRCPCRPGHAHGVFGKQTATLFTQFFPHSERKADHCSGEGRSSPFSKPSSVHSVRRNRLARLSQACQPAHLFIDKRHIVILYTSIGIVVETSVTTHTGIDLIVVNRNYFDMVFLRGTFGECLYQQVRIAALSRAA